MLVYGVNIWVLWMRVFCVLCYVRWIVLFMYWFGFVGFEEKKEVLIGVGVGSVGSGWFGFFGGVIVVGCLVVSMSVSVNVKLWSWCDCIWCVLVWMFVCWMYGLVMVGCVVYMNGLLIWVWFLFGIGWEGRLWLEMLYNSWDVGYFWRVNYLFLFK